MSNGLWREYIADQLETGIVLTNLGEKMTDEEVDELLKAVDTSSGEINYTGTLSTTTLHYEQRLTWLL